MAGFGMRAAVCVALGLAQACGSGARAAEIGESAEDPSAFSTVLHARDYDERFATVEDLLERAPGVRMRRFGGLGAYSTASIRGAKADQVLVLVDGVRVASAQRGAFDFSTLPLRQVERVEILRGGGSSRFGSDALGGVISVTTRRPESPEPAADLALAAGSHQTLASDASLAAGGFAGSYTRLESRNDFEFEHGGRSHRRLNADFVDQGGLLRGTFARGRDSRFEAMLWLHDRAAGEPGNVRSQPLTDISDERLSCTTADQGSTRALARLAWQRPLGRDGGFELSGYHRREQSRLDDPLGICGLVDPLVTGGRDRALLRETSSGLEAVARAPELELGSAWLGLRGSTSLRHDGVDSDDASAHRRTSAAFSLLGELELLDRHLRILPALGFETARTSEGLARRSSSAGFEEVSIADEHAWLPGIGAIVELAPGLRAKANWKRAFRRPSFSELFQPDFGYLRGNPRLRAERARNADVGLELALGRLSFLRELFVQAAVFRRDIDESVEWVFVSANTYMPLNTGPARVRGIELSASFELSERVELELGHSWTDARFVDRDPCTAALCSGVLPVFPHVPERQAFGRIGVDLGALRLYTELRHESEIGFQVGEQVSSDAALQVDAGLSLRANALPGLGSLPEGVSLSLDAINLGREQREDSLGQPLPREALFVFRIRAALP